MFIDAAKRRRLLLIFFIIFTVAIIYYVCDSSSNQNILLAIAPLANAEDPLQRDIGIIGNVPWGMTVSKSFILRNDGPSDVTFEVTPSCSCSSVNVNPAVLSPGEKGSLTLKFDSREYSAGDDGSIKNMTVIIKGNYNDGSRPFVGAILAKAKVLRTIDICSKISMGFVSKYDYKDARRNFTVLNYTDEPLTLKFHIPEKSVFRLDNPDVIIYAKDKRRIVLRLDDQWNCASQIVEKIKYDVFADTFSFSGILQMSVYPAKIWWASPSTVFLNRNVNNTALIELNSMEGHKLKNIDIVNPCPSFNIKIIENTVFVTIDNKNTELFNKSVHRYDLRIKCTSEKEITDVLIVGAF